MSARLRLVVFTAGPLSAVNRVFYERLAADPALDLRAIVVDGYRRPPRPLWRRIVRGVRQDGGSWLWFKASTTARGLAGKVALAFFDRVHHPRPADSYDSLSLRTGVAVHHVPDIHGEESLALVRSLRPQLGAIVGGRILRDPVITIPDYGTLNIHKRRVPDHRGGGPVGYWELLAGETSIGVTIHYATAQVDAGDVVAQTTIPIEECDTLESLGIKADLAGARLYHDALRVVASGRRQGTPQAQTPDGRTHRAPSEFRVWQLERRLRTKAASRMPISTVRPAPLVRARVALQLVLVSPLLLWLRRHLAKQRRAPVCVFFYHLVANRPLNHMCLPLEEFVRQMRFLHRYHPLVSLDQAVSRLTEGSDEVAVAVTFDDGYRDNTWAIEYLRYFGIPACFFISIGHILDGTPFEHDRARGFEAALPMREADVRQLASDGFEVGSHGVHHEDFGGLDPEAAERVMSESRRLIGEVTGSLPVHFSFPKGQRQTNMSEESFAHRGPLLPSCLLGVRGLQHPGPADGHSSPAHRQPRRHARSGGDRRRVHGAPPLPGRRRLGAAHGGAAPVRRRPPARAAEGRRPAGVASRAWWPMSRRLSLGVGLLALTASQALADLTGSEVHTPVNYFTLVPPPAGQSYLDPVFGTAVHRISDSRNQPNSADTGNLAFINHEYSTMSPFNQDASRILLVHQSYFALYDGDGRYQQDLPFEISASAEPRWSRHDPNLLYYVFGNSLKSYDVVSGVRTVVRTFVEYSTVDGRGESDICADGDHFVLVGNGHDIFVYEVSTDQKGPVLDASGHPFDNVHIAPGDGVIVTWYASGPARYAGAELFSRDMSFLRQLASVAGHADVARDTDGQGVLLWSSAADPQAPPECQNGVVKIRLADGQRTCLLNLDWGLGVHVSAADAGGWFFVSTYAPADPNPLLGAWRRYTGEVLQVRLDGSMVRRLAHHRSRPLNPYHYMPRAAASRDGRRLVYSSNYGLPAMLGYPTYYSDVYLVDVAATTPAYPGSSSSIQVRYEQDHPSVAVTGSWPAVAAARAQRRQRLPVDGHAGPGHLHLRRHRRAVARIPRRVGGHRPRVHRRNAPGDRRHLCVPIAGPDGPFLGTRPGPRRAHA